MANASPNDKAMPMAKKETTEIEIVSMSVYMCNLSFLLKKNSTTVISYQVLLIHFSGTMTLI